MSIFKRTTAAAAIFGGLFFITTAHAAPTPYVELMGPSFHTVKADIDGREYNNATYGVAAGLDLGQKASIEAGVYRNSFYRASVYVEFDYMPLSVGRVRIGAGAGVVSGYQRFSGGGYLTPMCGAVISYDLTNGDRLKLRVIPLFNGPSFKESTKFGGLFNIAYVHRL